jgi:hypothetical protein
MDDVTYDVYFGIHDPMNLPPHVGFNITVPKFDPSPIENLEFNTKYEWRIVAWDEYGYKTVGDPWFFITEENEPPNQADDPIPEDGANNIPIDLDYLYWNGSDPNSGDTLKYDVYFDDAFPLKKRADKQLDDYWEITIPLTLYQTYHWRIDTYDREGLKTEGINWSFTTGLNNPPEVTIQGPHQGTKNTEYKFQFTITDPDGHDVYLYVDWDDGNSGWIDGTFESGDTISLNHSWSKDREYTIEAKARDIFNAEGDSTYHDILIPRSKSLNDYPLLKMLINRFPILSSILFIFNNLGYI